MMQDLHFSPRPNRAHEIAWRPWEAATFAQAQAEDKPILLAISAVWCHWCHVMDETSYSDPEVIETINERFIPIKVDTDRRPDVNARYNMGGWPTTAFLTPNGETLYGETYVTPGRMLGLLQYVAEYYRTHKDEIVGEVTKHDAAVKAAEAAPTAGELSPEIVAEISDSLKANFDFAYGGFGTQPKFPHPEALVFAIEEWALRNDSEMKLVAEKT